MKRTISLALFATCLITGTSLSQAQDAPHAGHIALPAGITEEMLAPPPVPRFMLEKPDRPLTADEMMQQAHEAESKAGARRNIVKSPSEASATKPTK